MKFYTFDELTYPDVPAEIGPEVRFTNRFCDPWAVNKTYHEHLDEWVMCEDLGFDGAFVNEHNFIAINIQPACNIMATAIIMRTKTMKVGVIGNVLALRHPVRTAEEFAMLDSLSGGRFIAGIVRGVPQEYMSYNIDPFTGRKRLEESYEIIQRCLSEEGFDCTGKFWNLTGVSIWPKPIQNALPFWMPTGSRETIEFAAERRICGAQVFYPPEAYKESFDMYRQIAIQRFGWQPGYENFVGARLIHVAETNAQAIAAAREAVANFFRVFSRPVNDPVPGLHNDDSFQRRKKIKRDFPGPYTPFDQMRDDGFIVCGDPDYVIRRLENDMNVAGYGHFLGMFHAGNLAHEKVIASKRLFAEHVMPALRHINIDQPAQPPAGAAQSSASVLTARSGSETLPLYSDFNYTISRHSMETLGTFRRTENGKTIVGWEMQVPEKGPDGFPYQIIFVGPTAEQRGSAIRLSLATGNGQAIPDEAQVVLDTAQYTGQDTGQHTDQDRPIIFRGTYGQFTVIPDQHAPHAAIAVQQRTAAGDRYRIRLSISLPPDTAQPDLDADDSFFEQECFKHWMNVTA